MANIATIMSAYDGTAKNRSGTPKSSLTAMRSAWELRYKVSLASAYRSSGVKVGASSLSIACLTKFVSCLVISKKSV